jgi:ribosomal protein S18 acetylase RimI-like enzyme
MDSPPNILLRKDLRSPLPPCAVPDGVRIVQFRDAQAREAHALLAAAYSKGGGNVGIFEEWWPNLINDSEYDQASFFVALDAQERMVGLIQCWSVPYVKDLVVAASWRRRGLGEALLRHAFAFFHARGEPHIDLKVELNNPSGAERLYRRLGMSIPHPAAAKDAPR